MNKETLEKWLQAAYMVCFVVGTRSIRCLKSVVRFTRMLWAPIAHALYRAFDWLLFRHVRTVWGECKRIAADYRAAKTRLRQTAKNGRAKVVLEMAALPFLAFKRHRKAFVTAANVILPVLAVAALFFTVQYWRRAQFALSLEYDGATIGYIADERVYADAATYVRSTVINADDSFTVEQAPRMTLSVVNNVKLMSDREVGNRIINVVGDDLTQAAGLYVDGVFKGALSTETELKALMDRVLSTKKTKDADGVDFLPQTEIVTGLYPKTALGSATEIGAYLKSLPVKIMKNFTYVETVKYPVIYQETELLPLGQESVQQRGQNGSQRVLAQKIYVNGVLKYQVSLSTEILKQPTPQKVLIGAKKYSEDAEIGDGVATGTFVWPLPYTKVISSHFANRWGRFHGAIDIANGSTNGKPIIASDGGTVVEAEFHSSRGLNIVIDHGNGFKTRYAHCSVLEVKVGDKVAQGQYIPHLHFEVIKDGVLVDPLKYVQR